MLISRGAEAEIHLIDWMGKKTIMKHRVRKMYRAEQLDKMLRTKRTKIEARLISAARSIGVTTPIIYDIDTEKSQIIMEYINGARVKNVLNDLTAAERNDLCYRIGKEIGKLHKNDLIHGDLTTSNLILHDDDGRLYFIDFSLGEKNHEIEAKGVDLHVLMEAFESTHSEILDSFEHLLEGYRAEYQEASEIEDKIRDIIGRGRYKKVPSG